MTEVSSSAKIKCPYFLRQKEKEKNALYCCPIFDNQQSIKLTFKSAADKDSHLNNFCATGCYYGCPIAIAARERYELSEDIKITRRDENK